ncbi:hypothetical protein PCANC_12214 [Puccinia coronata f. sp. avenae]|uniref:Uncharacterized protein n=1 Tax=Puccinia coronata f. sp. avenae TaxID=200324 RepID=A0A2N5S4Y3_9BASI|nr:hypothetical protein PCANC_26822 [Puccinia coronata f. sp. avenae]PLW48568.1 hypothetical protein PCANC_12214 [Puccinia coronata f. sp. avenae]
MHVFGIVEGNLRVAYVLRDRGWSAAAAVAGFHAFFGVRVESDVMPPLRHRHIGGLIKTQDERVAARCYYDSRSRTIMSSWTCSSLTTHLKCMKDADELAGLPSTSADMLHPPRPTSGDLDHGALHLGKIRCMNFARGHHVSGSSKFQCHLT